MLAIPVTTIQTWQQRGIFTPAEPVKRRDPRGARLNVADLVVLSLIHSLLGIGLGFDRLAKGEFKSESETFSSIIGTPHLLLGENNFTFHDHGFSRDDKARLAREIQERRRPMQIYLEITDYKATLVVLSIPPPPGSQIGTWERSVVFRPEGLTTVGDVNELEAFLPVVRSIIRVEGYHYWVNLGLSELNMARARELETQAEHLHAEINAAIKKLKGTKRRPLTVEEQSDLVSATLSLIKKYRLLKTQGEELKKQIQASMTPEEAATTQEERKSKLKGLYEEINKQARELFEDLRKRRQGQ